MQPIQSIPIKTLPGAHFIFIAVQDQEHKRQYHFVNFILVVFFHSQINKRAGNPSPQGIGYYPLYYPLLRVLPLFRHSAPGPRPRHSTMPLSRRLRRVVRTISRLTPGQASSSWLKENDPRNLPTAASIICVLAPRGLLIWLRRLSNSL
jgi:hypothetical protein